MNITKKELSIFNKFRSIIGGRTHNNMLVSMSKDKYPRVTNIYYKNKNYTKWNKIIVNGDLGIILDPEFIDMILKKERINNGVTIQNSTLS